MRRIKARGKNKNVIARSSAMHIAQKPVNYKKYDNSSQASTT
jgi:hypothetical protein